MNEDHNFSVGEEVIIRDWCGMASEFEEDHNGIICDDLYFLYEMKPLCGRHVIIRSICGDRVTFCDDLGWYFNIHMIKSADEAVEDEQENAIFLQGIEALFAISV